MLSNVAIAVQSRDNNPFCGDQAAYWTLDNGNVMLCLADGMGHGPEAESAAKLAIKIVSDHLGRSLQEIFAFCDRGLVATRGAAVALGRIDRNTGILTYASIGNIEGSVGTIKRKRLLYDFGFLGGGLNRITPTEIQLAKGDLFIVCTDGIGTPDISIYDSVSVNDPGFLAQAIIQDYCNPDDDNGVLIWRQE